MGCLSLPPTLSVRLGGVGRGEPAPQGLGEPPTVGVEGAPMRPCEEFSN